MLRKDYKMSLVDYAENELALLGMTGDLPENDPDRWMHDNIMACVEAFAGGGHSGYSAAYAVGILEKLLRFEPITEITYGPEQWIDQSYMSGTLMWQHKRRSTTFSVDQGITHYDLND
jgi:hypothetical protein